MRLHDPNKDSCSDADDASWETRTSEARIMLGRDSAAHPYYPLDANAVVGLHTNKLKLFRVEALLPVQGNMGLTDPPMLAASLKDSYPNRSIHASSMFTIKDSFPDESSQRLMNM